MRVDLSCDQHQLSWDRLVARVRYAEQAGFTGAWLFDHFKTLYGSADGPCFEAWTLLAALAATTTTIRLGPLVTGVTYRHPSVLAAEAVTVDHVSGGRLDFGIGAAWFGQEHEELGIDFPPAGERLTRLDEALHVITLLMTEDRATFKGRFYRLADARYRPFPVQRPHPPVWVGGGGVRRLLPIAARHADVWHGFGPVGELAFKSRVLDRLCEEAGRDPATVARSTSLSLSEPWDVVRRRADELRQAGFSILIADWPSEGQERMDEFVDKVLPQL